MVCWSIIDLKLHDLANNNDTFVVEMREPPQLCLPPYLLRDTCQGNSLTAATSPPTILSSRIAAPGKIDLYHMILYLSMEIE